MSASALRFAVGLRNESSHHSHTIARGLDLRPVPPPPFRVELRRRHHFQAGDPRAGFRPGLGGPGSTPSSAGATHAALHAAHPADVAAAAAAAAAAPPPPPPPPPPPKPRRPKFPGRPAAAALLLLDRGGCAPHAGRQRWCVCVWGGRRDADVSRLEEQADERTARRVNSGARRRSCGSSGPGRRGGTPSSEDARERVESQRPRSERRCSVATAAEPPAVARCGAGPQSNLPCARPVAALSAAAVLSMTNASTILFLVVDDLGTADLGYTLANPHPTLDALPRAASYCLLCAAPHATPARGRCSPGGTRCAMASSRASLSLGRRTAWR